MKKLKFIQVFAHPLFISGILTLIFIFFLKGIFLKYQAKVTEYGFSEKPESSVCWADFFNDGESEKLEWFNNTEGKATYKITSQTGIIEDQQVFNGQSLTFRNPPIFTDLDMDRFPEVYAFYHRNDSLFFRSVEYGHGKSYTISKEFFAVKVTNGNGEKDYSVQGSPKLNQGRDSVRVLIFSVNAGYPVIPRSIFIFDPASGKLIHSGFLGATSGVTGSVDINRDGKKEYLVMQYAPGNLTDSLIEGVNDQFVRLLVLNDRLEPIFDPPVFEGKYSSIEILPVKSGEQVFLVVLVFNSGNKENEATLMVFTSSGKLMAKKKLMHSIDKYNVRLIDMKQPGTYIHLFDNRDILTTYNLYLETKDRKKFPGLFGSQFEFDLDQDGNNEYIFNLQTEPYFNITRKGLKNPVRVGFQANKFLDFRLLYLKKNIGKPNELSAQYRGKYLLISYSANPLFPFRFLVWLLIYSAFSGFIFLIQYLQRLTLREKYRAEQRISQLQLLLMRNQITPHFLFNAINSVSYRLMEKNPEEANNSVVRLSRLIRSNLVSTDRFSRTLKEELDAAKAYIEIIRSQCEKPFTFSAEVDPATDLETEVPVMVIQNYLENAVKHGVRTMGANGRVHIAISRDVKCLHIQITDNGVGRRKASENTDKSGSTGKGTGLMQQYFDEVNKYNESKISVAIKDLYDDKGTPAGTKVKIEIPVNMKYHIYEK